MSYLSPTRVTRLNTRPQDGESTRGKVSHHNVTRSGVRKSQEPCAVPVSVTTGQRKDTQTHGHTDTQTHRHRDTETQRHRHRQRCACVGWSTNRDNEIAKIIINYLRRQIRHLLEKLIQNGIILAWLSFRRNGISVNLDLFQSGQQSAPLPSLYVL